MENERYSYSNAIGGLITWGVFIIGLGLMAIKTADVMAIYSPEIILGYTGVEYIYGMTVTLLLEGVVFAGKLKLQSSDNPRAWLGDIAITAIPFVLSAMMQVFDGFFVMGNLAEQPPEIRLLMSYLVPLVPAIIIALVLVQTIIENNPALRSRGNPNHKAVQPTETPRQSVHPTPQPRRPSVQRQPWAWGARPSRSARASDTNARRLNNETETPKLSIRPPRKQ